jgi:hypothetical protein
MRHAFILITVAAAALEIGACSHDTNPPQNPTSQTQTTGGYPSPTTGNPDFTGVMPPQGDIGGYGTSTSTGTGTGAGTGTMLPSGRSEQRNDSGGVQHDRSTDIESRGPLRDGGT